MCMDAPSPRRRVGSASQHKDMGAKAVEKALQLYEELRQAEEAVAKLRATAEDTDLPLDKQAELQLAEATKLAAQARYESKLAELGVQGQQHLRRLTKSKLLHVRANGLVLLRRVHAGVMKRKMEVERVVRSHRNKQSGGGKQHLHDLMH